MADETLVLEMETAFEQIDVDDRSYVLAITRGHQHDKPVVEQALRTDAAFIGMIGSRRKIALMWKELEAKGFPRERLHAVHAPLGLDIGADNPEEIAVSVVAELISNREIRRQARARSAIDVGEVSRAVYGRNRKDLPLRNPSEGASGSQKGDRLWS